MLFIAVTSCLPYSEIWKSTEDRKQYPDQPFPSVPRAVGEWLVLALRMDQTRLTAIVSTKLADVQQGWWSSIIG